MRFPLVRPVPLRVGEIAPPVSLTADDGRWIRSADLHGRQSLIVLFFRDAEREATGRALQAWEAARSRVTALDAQIVGVNHARPEHLRATRERLDLGYPLVYDLLAATARAWRQSGRRPYVRDGVAVVDRDGRIALHLADLVDPAAVLPVLERASRPETASAAAGVRRTAWAEVAGLLAGAPAVLLDVRTPDEHAALRHPAARNIPVDELPARIGELPPGACVVCVCQTGGRSAAAAAFLHGAGFAEVHDVIGGMTAWPGASSG